MRRFRLFLAWLLLAAIPLQGMAAASMLFCGSQAHEAAAAAHGHDSAHDHGDVASHVHGDAHDGATVGHTDVTCSVCASCCSGAAISEAAAIVAVRLRATPPPDKPPRA